MKSIMKCLMVSMLFVLFAGCSKDDEPGTEPEPEKVTYSVTYSVNKISDDFFTLGHFIVSYIDKDSKDRTVDLKKSSQIPFSVTVEGLDVDSKLYFELIYGYYSEVELTKEQYTFARDASFTIKGSDGSVYSASIITSSLTVGKDKVKAYLDKVTLEDNPLESTVKDVMRKK